MIRAPIDVHAPEAEAFRALRTNLAFAQLPDDRRAVLFTSARRGEGKSTIVANFAVACAYSERPTLLIDGDLRKPEMHRVFRQSNEVGLSTLLAAANGVALPDVACSTLIPHLDLLPAGPSPPNPAELLSRSSMADLLSAARERYDWVLVDSPPVLAVTDAAIVSDVVDGVVLVVNLRRSRMRLARKARDVLHSVRAPLLGVVVNESKSGPLRRADVYAGYRG